MESIAQLLGSSYYIQAVPTYLAMRCSDRKTNGRDCSICADVCPVGIYPVGKRKRPDWTNCLKCGICSATCPDRCLTPPAPRVDNFLIAVGKSGEMSIACAEDSAVMSLGVSCLAAVSWEQMAYAALTKGLVISLNACDSCPRENFKALIRENLDKLRFFLGDELFSRKVTVLEHGAPYEPTDTGMSRRELFNIFKNLPLDKAIRALPEAPSQSSDAGLFYRAMLRDAVQALADQAEKAPADREGKKPEKPRFRMRLPVFSDKCFNCNTCTFTCPQKALKILQQGEYLIPTVEAWRCNGCEICVRSCRFHALDGLAPMRITTLGRVALRRIKAYPCASCGKPRPADAEEGLCSSCLARTRAERNRKKQEEMRAKQKAEREAAAAREAAEKEAAEKAAAEAAALEAGAGAETASAAAHEAAVKAD